MAYLPNVYDYFNPSPIPLEQLACMEVALILWRREILQNVTESGTLRERYPRKKTSLRCLFPKLPTTILRKIERYVIDLQHEIPKWLEYHSREGLLDLDVVLKHFQDFVFDFNGRLHYGRTAKRFVACKGINDFEKFKMACWYCLEDDILRIWPRVSSRVMANENHFHLTPLFRYWACRLTNEPHDIFGNVPSIEELTLEELRNEYHCAEWLCAKYFFSRLSWETRMKHIADVLEPNHIYKFISGFENIFFRYMLAKLNEAELKEVVKKYGAELIFYSQERYNLRIWDYIKNKITDNEFCRLVKYILKNQTESHLNYNESAYLEFWNSASNRLKQAAIRDALLVDDSSHFDRRRHDKWEDFRSISFLLAALSDTPIEDRKRFWKAHWKTLYVDIRPSDFRFLINLCFNNDQNQIISFKEVVSKNHRLIHSVLKTLFEDGYLEELEEFLMFWCPNERSIKEFRLMLLYDNFKFPSIFTGAVSSLNKFIEKAFEDAVLPNDFKNRVFVLPEDMGTIEYITTCIDYYKLSRVMEFVDTFALSDEVKHQIKVHRIMPTFKTSLIKPPVRLVDYLEKNFDEFESFIVWLFENDDEITRFKEALDVDELIQEFIDDQKSFLEQSRYRQLSDWFDKCFQTLNTPDDDSGVKKILKWYFVTPEAVEMFEKKYSHDYVFNRLLL